MNIYRLIFFSLLLSLVFPLTLYAGPVEDANAAIKNEDYKKAYELLLPLAENNDPEVQTLLGALYANGQGVEMDFNKGMALIMKAATKGYKPAQLMAFKLCIDLGNKGDASAMYNVGYMCLKGWGGEQDSNTCLRWLESGAKMGHEKSASFLSSIYKKGTYGITPDEEKATYWNNLPEAFAAGVGGKWEGSVPGMMGGPPMKRAYDFKTEGDKLTGTALGYDGKEVEIIDGKIDGNNISFKVESNFQGKKNTVSYSALFLGDELKVSYVPNMPPGPGGKAAQPISFMVKRVE